MHQKAYSGLSVKCILMTQVLEFLSRNLHIALRHDSRINVRGFMLAVSGNTGRILRFSRDP
jgi:hypothetical protein